MCNHQWYQHTANVGLLEPDQQQLATTYLAGSSSFPQGKCGGFHPLCSVFSASTQWQFFFNILPSGELGRLPEPWSNVCMWSGSGLSYGWVWVNLCHLFDPLHSILVTWYSYDSIPALSKGGQIPDYTPLSIIVSAMSSPGVPSSAMQSSSMPSISTLSMSSLPSSSMPSLPSSSMSPQHPMVPPFQPASQANSFIPPSGFSFNAHPMNPMSVPLNKIPPISVPTGSLVRGQNVAQLRTASAQ